MSQRNFTDTKDEFCFKIFSRITSFETRIPSMKFV